MNVNFGDVTILVGVLPTQIYVLYIDSAGGTVYIY